MTQSTESDSVLSQWLCALEQKVSPRHIDIKIVDRLIVCRCAHLPAFLAMEEANAILKGCFEIKIFVGEDELYSSVS